MFSDGDGMQDVFRENAEYPLLLVIQIFINPDIYQSKYFTDGSAVSCTNCMEKLRVYIEGLPDSGKYQWQMFQLLTEGDFLIVVRAQNLHTAYDISTYVRSICVSDEKGNRVNAFFSYSIAGLWQEAVKPGNSRTLLWNKYLEGKDAVLVRMVYSSDFRVANKSEEDICESEALLQDGCRMLGRYDYQISFSPDEFTELYPYLTDFKFSKAGVGEKENDSFKSEKVEHFVWILKKNYVTYINERIVLTYEKDPLLNRESGIVWRVEAVEKWETLYEKNLNMLEVKRIDSEKFEQRLIPFYQSARNLKEYVRLFRRMYRVLYEMNSIQELRIAVSNSLSRSARCRNLYFGILIQQKIGRRRRLQTPNYDLQTNVCGKVASCLQSVFAPFYGWRPGNPGRDRSWISPCGYTLPDCRTEYVGKGSFCLCFV